MLFLEVRGEGQERIIICNIESDAISVIGLLIFVEMSLKRSSRNLLLPAM